MIGPQEVLNDYADVQLELFKLTQEKINQYGTSRYNNHSPLFNLWMCFSDVWRKVLRLEKLTHHAVQKDDEALDKLIDDYRDIANYATMAVQILRRYQCDLNN